METKPGTKILKYTLVRIIGTGGWGEVWEAVNKDTGEKVAIKILRPSGKQTKPGRKARERFRREAEVMCRLQSPWLCHAYTCCDDDNAPFMAFVMEYIEGSNLSEYVRKKGAPDAEDIKKWMYQLLSALDEIHNRGIVHRDIKPSNIMLQPSGDIKLFDFGICKDLTIDYDNTHIAVYSTYYASPEQKMGDPETPLDSMTDYYSLGKTLWFLSTGKLPPATLLTAEHLQQVRDKDLRRAIEAMTMENTDKRRTAVAQFIASVEGKIPDELPTMADMGDENQAIKDSEELSEAPTMADESVTGTDREVKKGRMGRPMMTALFLFLALALGIGAYFLTRTLSKPGSNLSVADSARQSDVAETVIDTTKIAKVSTPDSVGLNQYIASTEPLNPTPDTPDKAKEEKHKVGNTDTSGKTKDNEAETTGGSEDEVVGSNVVNSSNIGKAEYNRQLDAKLRAVEANPTPEGLREVEKFVKNNLISHENARRIQNLHRKINQ